jgi:prophage antirepressor-like protein
MENSNQIAVFEQSQIRRIEQGGETWFSIVDIIEVLTESKDPRNYWKVLKNREPQLVTICNPLKLLAKDGKKYATDCANTEGVLRIIQSVPSPKAEPFKMWLAGLGKQAIEEVNNPELMTERQAELYRAKGYSEEWIKNRLQSISTRKELTDEWQKRGVKEGQEYSILTATIAKGTFGLTPSEHSQLKGLKNENLRDHMTPMELILTALSEEVTRTITVDNDAQGFNENHEAAQKGGEVGKKARLNVEKATGKKVVSATNFLEKTKELNEKKED